jgi:WD40 repeat protein
MLYHLLTSRPPHVGESFTRTLQMVVEGEVVSPRLLNPNVAGDLETICNKCLEKEPSRRYSSAQELADELGRYLQGEPIRARPVSLVGKTARWCRRKPALAAALGAVAGLVLVIAIGSPIAALRINRSRQLAEAANGRTQLQLYHALVEQARAMVHSAEMGHRVSALEAIRQAAAITNTPELRREALAALALADLRPTKEIQYAAGDDARALDPAFKRDAVCRTGGRIDIRDVESGRTLFTLPGMTNQVGRLVAWSGDGKYLAVKRDYEGSNRNADLEVWNMASTQPVLYARGQLAGSAFAFHPLLPQIVAGDQAGEARVWDLENGKEVRRIALPCTPISLRYSGEGSKLGVAGRTAAGELLIAIVSAAGGEVLLKNVTLDAVTSLEWDPTGRWLATVDMGGNVLLVDAKNGQARILGRHKAPAVTATFSPDGAHLITGGWEKEMICWDPLSGDREFTIARNSFNLQFSADGRQCALLTWLGCQICSVERPAFQHEFRGALRSLPQYAALSSNGRWLAAADKDHLGVWDLADNGPGALVPEGAGSYVFFTAADDLIATRDDSHSHHRWKLTPATNAAEAPGLIELPMPADQGVSSICVVSNSLALTGQQGSRLAPLDDAGANPPKWLQTASGLNSASADGRWLAIFAPFSKVVQIYRLPGFECAASLTNQDSIGGVTFSPSSDEVAVGSPTRVEIWSTATWQRTREIVNFMRLLYAPREKAWWLTTDFRSGGLYDARSQTPLLPLPTGMLPAAASADERLLAVTVDGQHLQVWDLAEIRRQFRDLGVDWPEPESR